MNKNLTRTFVAILISLVSATNTYATSSSIKVETPITGYTINKYFDVIPNNKNGNKKVVLLTFDDGPTKQATNIMATLTKHNAKAIFFINGIHDKENPDIISEEAKNGFYVGNHTWDHQNLKSLKQDKAQKEIDKNTELITKKAGIAPRFFRAPFGVGTPFVREYVKKNNMIYMNWSGAAKDWEKNTKDKKIFIKNVMKDLHPGSVILMHEHPWTVSALDDLLTAIEKDGYVFLDPKDISSK